METHKVEVAIPAAEPVIVPHPVEPQVQALTEQLADLRERFARTEERLAQVMQHNPASEEALRLATEAHKIASALEKTSKKAAKESADGLAKITELPPPAPVLEPEPETLTDHLEPEPESLTLRKHWWSRFS